jgi:hypothetical protein
MKTTFRDLNTLTTEERRRVAQIYDFIFTWKQDKQLCAVATTANLLETCPEAEQASVELSEVTTPYEA